MSWVLERNVLVFWLGVMVLQSERWGEESPGPSHVEEKPVIFVVLSRVQRAHPYLVSSEGGHIKQVFTIGLAQSPQAAVAAAATAAVAVAAAAASDRTRPGIQGPLKALIGVNIE